MFIACSIIYRKEAIHKAGIERPSLATKGFNTNLVQFLNFYRCIMLLLVMHASTLLPAQFSLCTDMHLKQFCTHKILCMKNYNLWRPDYVFAFIKLHIENNICSCIWEVFDLVTNWSWFLNYFYLALQVVVEGFYYRLIKCNIWAKC